MTKLVLVLAFAFVVVGCAGQPEFGTVTTQIPQDCETLAGSVGRPAFKDEEDFRVIAGRYAQRLASANHRLDATKKCQADVREGFAAKVK